MPLTDLKTKGVTHLWITKGQAESGTRTDSGTFYSKPGIDLIPCPSVEDGVYEIERFTEQWQAIHNQKWVDVMLEEAKSFKLTRIALRLKVEEKPKAVYQIEHTKGWSDLRPDPTVTIAAAKETVAKNYGYKTWDDLRLDCKSNIRRFEDYTNEAAGKFARLSVQRALTQFRLSLIDKLEFSIHDMKLAFELGLYCDSSVKEADLEFNDLVATLRVQQALKKPIPTNKDNSSFWIPVANHIPHDGTPVRACSYDSLYNPAEIKDGVFYFESKQITPTHWQPLPEPPEA